MLQYQVVMYPIVLKFSVVASFNFTYVDGREFYFLYVSNKYRIQTMCVGACIFGESENHIQIFP